MRVYFDLAPDLTQWYNSQPNKKTALNAMLRAGIDAEKGKKTQLDRIEARLNQLTQVEVKEVPPPQRTFDLSGLASMATVDDG